MKANSISAKISTEEGVFIEFTLDGDVFQAYRRGKMANEMFLPLNELWKGRVFSEGWKLKPELKLKAVKIKDRKTGSILVAKIWGSAVRFAPIREYERSDKHIVLYLK